MTAVGDAPRGEQPSCASRSDPVAGPDNTLPLYVFSSIRRGVTPKINAIASVMLAVTLTFLFVAQLLLRRTGRRGSGGTAAPGPGEAGA